MGRWGCGRRGRLHRGRARERRRFAAGGRLYVGPASELAPRAEAAPRRTTRTTTSRASWRCGGLEEDSDDFSGVLWGQNWVGVALLFLGAYLRKFSGTSPSSPNPTSHKDLVAAGGGSVTAPDRGGRGRVACKSDKNRERHAVQPLSDHHRPARTGNDNVTDPPTGRASVTRISCAAPRRRRGRHNAPGPKMRVREHGFDYTARASRAAGRGGGTSSTTRRSTAPSRTTRTRTPAAGGRQRPDAARGRRARRARDLEDDHRE